MFGLFRIDWLTVELTAVCVSALFTDGAVTNLVLDCLTSPLLNFK